MSQSSPEPHGGLYESGFAPPVLLVHGPRCRRPHFVPWPLQCPANSARLSPHRAPSRPVQFSPRRSSKRACFWCIVKAGGSLILNVYLRLKRS